jgi:hypothetical protein
MSEFHVGEIAIYVRPGSRFFGQEVRVTRSLFLNPYKPSEWYGKTCYMIVGLDVGEASCLPEHLRKKQQKRDIDQIVSWDDCVWKPKREMA